MNLEILYQWREEIARHLPSLNSWQVDNVALFTQGIIHAESSQQETIARKVVCGERTSSASRRLRRFLANDAVDMSGFFANWTNWVLSALAIEKIYLCVWTRRKSVQVWQLWLLLWHGQNAVFP